MVIIKRYPNRKLYNTRDRQYINLEGIATLIRQGEEIQILDHTSGEDLTAVTLSQVILEREKKEGGFLPRSVLAGLVQSGGLTLDSLRRSLESPLGLKVHVDREIELRIKRLVRQEQLTEEEGRHIRQKLLEVQMPDSVAGSLSDAEIEHLLSEINIPPSDELQRLYQQLEELVQKLEELSPGA